MTYEHPLYTPESVAAQRTSARASTRRASRSPAPTTAGASTRTAPAPASSPPRTSAWSGRPVADRRRGAWRWRHEDLAGAPASMRRRSGTRAPTPVRTRLRPPQPHLARRPRRPPAARRAQPAGPVRGPRPPRRPAGDPAPEPRHVPRDPRAWTCAAAGSSCWPMPRVLGTSSTRSRVFWCHDAGRRGSCASSSRCTTPTATGTPTSSAPTARPDAPRSPRRSTSARSTTCPAATGSPARPRADRLRGAGRPEPPGPRPVRRRPDRARPAAPPRGTVLRLAADPAPRTPRRHRPGSAGTASACGCAACRSSPDPPTPGGSPVTTATAGLADAPRHRPEPLARPDGRGARARTRRRRPGSPGGSSASAADASPVRVELRGTAPSSAGGDDPARPLMVHAPPGRVLRARWAPTASSGSASPTWPATGTPRTSAGCSRSSPAQMATLVPAAAAAAARPLRRPAAAHRAQHRPTNTRGNIARHYDLSNDLFAHLPRRDAELLLRAVRRRPATGALSPASRQRAGPPSPPSGRPGRGQARKIERLLDQAGVGDGHAGARDRHRLGRARDPGRRARRDRATVTLSSEQQALARERIGRGRLRGPRDRRAARLPRGPAASSTPWSRWR